MSVVKIFGDSHSSYFKLTPRVLKLLGSPNLKSTVNVYKGGSMAGFGKRESTLNLSNEVKKSIESDDFVILNFGQVDIELGFYYKKIIKDNEQSTIQHMNEIIEKYMVFIKSLDNNRIIIKGLNAPSTCHSENQWQNFIMRIISPNTLSEVDNQNINTELIKRKIKNLPSDDSIRTKISLEFNKRLKTACHNNNVHYFDINEELIDKNTGILKNSFITPVFDNHITDSIETRLLHWNGALKEIKKIKENEVINGII